MTQCCRYYFTLLLKVVLLFSSFFIFACLSIFWLVAGRGAIAGFGDAFLCAIKGVCTHVMVAFTEKSGAFFEFHLHKECTNELSFFDQISVPTCAEFFRPPIHPRLVIVDRMGIQKNAGMLDVRSRNLDR